MVRLVGRVKKKEEGGIGAATFFVQILSIQEAGWEDVKWTRKAVCSAVFLKKGKLGKDGQTCGKD
jgi:hypothetical protein